MALAQDSILNLTLCPIYANHHMHTHLCYEILLDRGQRPRSPLVELDPHDLMIEFN